MNDHRRPEGAHRRGGVLLSGAPLARHAVQVSMADIKGATEAFVTSRSRAMVGNSLLGKLLPGP